MSLPSDLENLIGEISIIEDHTVDEDSRHELIDVIAIAICAVICDADNWVEVQEFGNARREWLGEFLRLPNGIPSYDTFGRVFAAIDPDVFRECFSGWVSLVYELASGRVASEDEMPSGSSDRSSGKSAISSISVWGSAGGIVLGQMRTDAHSSEVVAISEVLPVLDLTDCIVTIDAEGCQRGIAESIVSGEGDYILTVKADQGMLLENVGDVFERAAEDGCDEMYDRLCEIEIRGQGRIERQACRMVADPEQMSYVDPEKSWIGLKSVVNFSSERRTSEDVSSEERYYISSLDADANVETERVMVLVQEHREIEDSTHWALGVAFDENSFLSRVAHSDRNLDMARRMTQEMLKRESSLKAGIKAKRRKAGWDNEYLLKTLSV